MCASFGHRFTRIYTSFWHNKRQAMQNPISATVVIDNRKKMDKQKANNEGVKAK